MVAVLAEVIASFAVERNFKIRRVRRLLKSTVAFNAFREYMRGLLEPDTGLPSTSTMRRAQMLGRDTVAFISRISGDNKGSLSVLSRCVLCVSVCHLMQNYKTEGIEYLLICRLVVFQLRKKRHEARLRRSLGPHLSASGTQLETVPPQPLKL